MVIREAWKSRLSAALIAGAFSGQVLAADPVLSITATPDPAVLGAPVSIDVLISGIADLYAYQFSLSFDPAVLQATTVTEGPFLASGGGTTVFGAGTIDNTTGSVAFTYDTLIGAVAGVSGTGTLAHISFDVIARGSTPLTFSDVVVLDSNLADVRVQVEDRVLQAVPEPGAWLLFGLGLAGFAAVRRQHTR
jgi:hypothetical protein